MLEADPLCSLHDTFSLEDNHSRRLRCRAARYTIYALIPTRAAVQPWAGMQHVAIQGSEHDGVAALAAPACSGRFAAAVPASPGVGLSLNDPALDGGEQCLALCEREADVLMTGWRPALTRS